MNKELLEALEILEKEKNIPKDVMVEAIESSLIIACKNHFGKADNVRVTMNKDTGDFAVYAEKTVVEQVEDPVLEIMSAGMWCRFLWIPKSSDVLPPRAQRT